MVKVSIICLTYNHEKFIAQAIDGFLNQKTDFEFEVLVHDDVSTDATPAILEKYANLSNGIVKPIFETENQFSKGNFDFVNSIFKQAKGEYIALCEGDDFWSDSNKLQAQVDFLENNPEYAVCFHRVKVFTEGNEGLGSLFPDPNDVIEFTVKELLQRNFIQTNSVMYRCQKYADLPSNVIPGDWYMHLYHAQYGKIGFIDRVMSVYRKHPGGVWWESDHNADEVWRKYGLGHLALFCEILKLYGGNPEYRPIINQQIDDMFSRLISIDNKYGTQLATKGLAAYPESGSLFIGTLIQAIQNNERDIADLNKAITRENQQAGELRLKLSQAMVELNRAKQSKSFLTGYYLLHPKALARFSVQTMRRSAKKSKAILSDMPEVIKAQRAYASKNFLKRPIVRSENTKIAVVLHLYFTETWPEFGERLKTLQTSPFDLFVTLPENNASFAEIIVKTYPNVYILTVPNRGRDVLPFMQIAPLLLSHGYEYLLKLHSKKSAHRTDGSDWLSGMVRGLIPSDPAILRRLLETLDDSSTGIIGPQGQYVSLPVNFNENKHYISLLLTEIRSQRISQHVSNSRGDFGFFAGTMFWARLDALRPIIGQNFTVKNFDPEKGQIDATFAHALERIFCLVPELDGKSMYEVGDAGVVRIDYKTGNIPDWSEVYIAPKY